MYSDIFNFGDTESSTDGANDEICLLTNDAYQNQATLVMATLDCVGMHHKGGLGTRPLRWWSCVMFRRSLLDAYLDRRENGMPFQPIDTSGLPKDKDEF